MNEKTCPTCHASVPANAPGGFCPSCLLRGAEELPAAGHGSPSLEEISAAFPQLEVLGLIGQGGMGFVYQVRQPDLDRMAALKILSPELGKDPAFAERFARESRALGRLNHPNIVTIFEHGQSGGFFYLLMEHVDGVNLRQAMRAGRFTPEQALAIVPGICDALQAAHAQGVWHRDIKPENILLDGQGGVKIADFGIARMAGEREWNFTLTRTGGALGSAAYMAPEQHENPRGVDHRADIYSLGVVIYEMLTGELPLGRFPAPSQRAAVNARIDEIVFRTLEKERELRQQSATEVKTEMLGVKNTMPPVVPSPAAAEQPRNLIVALLLVCMAGYTAWAFFTGVRVVLFLGGVGALSSVILGILTWRTWPGRIATVVWALIVLAMPAFVWLKPVLVPVESTPPGPPRAPRTIVQSPTPTGPRRRIPPSPHASAGHETVEPKASHVDTVVDWNIFLPANGKEPATTRNVKGRLNSGSVSGYEYSSVAITAGNRDWLPVCMIVSKGGMNGQSRKTDGTTLKGSAVMAKRRIEYEIRGPDKIVIGGKEEDLRQGRVFMCRPDGSVRQIASFPREFISENEIDDFAAALPKEQHSWQQAIPEPAADPTDVDHEKTWAPWAAFLKEGDVHQARGDLAAALASYQGARTYISQRQKGIPGTWQEEQAECEGRIGDVLRRQGDLAGTVGSYLLRSAILKRLLEKEPENGRIRDQLVRAHVRMGDAVAGLDGQPGSEEWYRRAVAVADELQKDWEESYPIGSYGDKLGRNYRAEEVLRLIDKPDRDPWDLMWMIGRAGANKDRALETLLERKDLKEEPTLAIALAGYDWSLNGNQEALGFILGRLAKETLGADSNEVVVLSHMDEWNHTVQAVNSHFLAADGAGGENETAFWRRRSLLFPRNYLVYRGKADKEPVRPVLQPQPGSILADAPANPGKPLVNSSDNGMKWKVTEDFTPGQAPRVLEFSGKLTPEAKSSANHTMFTVHLSGNPVFVIVGAGWSSGHSNSTKGRELDGTFRMNQPISYRIDDGDRATIGGHVYDLKKGRVFLVRPDNTLRQIAMRPQRMIPVEALEKFITDLPPEK